MSVINSIKNCKVEEGKVAVFWLGQAGFLLKDSNGKTVAIDPYLTNCGEAMRGFKRLSPMLIDPSEFAPDYYIVTHIHFDHFDFEAIPQVNKNAKTHFIGPSSCIAELTKLNISNCTELNDGNSIELQGIKITAVNADHGTMAPDAIGVVVEIGGKKIYFSGDTAYKPEWFKEYAKMGLDVAIVPINGAFGNMNSEEAAKAASDLGVKIVIPCHFWTLSEHGGDVQGFRTLMAEKEDVKALMFYQGEGALV